MDKYKLLIADDESDVRESIVSHIDWDTLGYEVVAEAENGEDALEKAEATEIDVALTDIKMPFMDGLEMGARLTEMYPNIKLIILSGFDEFQYAKTAITLNVVEYVLKPINAAELSDVLRRVKAQLDAEIARRRDVDMLRKSYAESLPLMREHFLTELMWGIAPTEQIDERLERYGLDVGGAPYCAAAVFEPDRSQTRPALITSELVPVSVRQLVEEQLNGRCRYAVFTGSSFITALTSWDSPDSIGALVGMANEICSRCAKVLDVIVTAGIGRVRSGLREIHGSFKEARSALEYKAVTGPGKAIYIQDMERVQREAVSVDGREWEQILSAIKFGVDEHFDQHANKLLEGMPKGGGLERKAFALYIYSALYRLMQRYGMLEAADMLGCIGSFTENEEMWADPARLKIWLTGIFTLMSRYINTERLSAARDLADDAKNYIKANYQDHNLSVNTVCRRLHVSQSHFSAVFKQETGKSFVQYLTALRLDRAVGLLESTDFKTYEIARRVGFEEPNYFSYTFKKHLGVSPTRYRGTKT